MQPAEVVERFNAAINARDLVGLDGCMTDDHVFIDSADQVVRGKRACLEAWQGFFESFPDYRNVFETVTSSGDLVTVRGYSTCSFAPLDGPAIWTARVRHDRVAQWRVSEATTV